MKEVYIVNSLCSIYNNFLLHTTTLKHFLTDQTKHAEMILMNQLIEGIILISSDSKEVCLST